MPTPLERNYLISAKDLWDQIGADIGDVGGIYKLHCLKQDGSGYIGIPRLLAIDANGVLYIGVSSISLRQRIAQLRKAISAAAGRDGFIALGAHPCGYKYKEVEIQRSFPYERLCVTVYPGNPGFDAGELESAELANYEKTFGEAPPFNEGRPKAKWLNG